MARFRIGLALVCALALTLVACGSSSESETLDIQKAAREIARLSNDVYGAELKVGDVHCPSSVPQEKDLTFFCTVDIEGQPLRVDLRQTNAKGGVKIHQAQAVLVTQKMRDVIESYLAGKGTPANEVNCGKLLVVVATPGQKVTCGVTYPDGSKAVATFGVKNTSGDTPLLSVKPSS